MFPGYGVKIHNARTSPLCFQLFVYAAGQQPDCLLWNTLHELIPNLLSTVICVTLMTTHSYKIAKHAFKTTDFAFLPAPAGLRLLSLLPLLRAQLHFTSSPS